MPTREYVPRGYVASKPRHEVDEFAITGDSNNFLIDPNEEKLIRRSGQTTPSGWDSVLNTAWSGNKPRGRQIIGMRARQLTDQSQHPAVLFTDDSSDAKRGEVVTYDSTQADWYSLGQEYGTTHYPATTGYYGGTGAAGSGLTLNYRWAPFWSNATSAPRYHRGTTAANRLGMFGGGRAMLEVGEWLYGMVDGSPWMWRKTWNYATGSGSNINRARQWGHQVPLYHPVITAQGGTSSVAPWRKFRTFYYATAFMFEDGSVGPFTPIQDNVANLMSNGTRGRVILDATNDYYGSMLWSNIPRGGKGVIGRVLARTAQIDSSDFHATYPGANDLRVITIIHNNTQTTYSDTQGDDVTLTATPDIVRIDLKWPRRGKYLVANDGRFLMCGALRPNPAAIVLAPTGISATRDINQYGNATGNYITDPDSQRSDEYLASPGTRGFHAELSSTAARLHFDNGAADGVSSFTHTVSGVAITLQALCDLINQSTTASSGKEWAAVVAPGADPDAPCTALDFTTDNCKVGDDARPNGLSSVDDIIWVRGPADPIVFYFNKAYLDTFPADDQAIEFTRGGPSDVPSAIMNWSASKECERKPADAFVGRCLGAAPIDRMFIVFYERGIYALRSVNNESFQDADMRLQPLIVGNVHVVADSSIFWGTGFAGCVTDQGVFVTDGSHFEILSEDVYSKEKATGAWLNEIARSLKATQNGGRTAGGDEPFLYAAVLGGQIHVTYRRTATAANDERLVYDFSPGSKASGLPAVLRRDRSTYGWSSKLTNTVGVMAEIADQTGGMVRYGVVENVAQGRVDKFDTGLTDNGSAVTAAAYFATDMCKTARLKKLSGAIVVVYKKNGTGLTLTLARDQGSSPTSHGADTYSKALGTTGALLYNRAPVDLDPGARTPTEVFEVQLTDDGSGDPSEIWRVLLPYEPTDFPR